RTPRTQSTLRLGRRPDDHRGYGRDRVFSVLSSYIPCLCCARASFACGSIPHPPDRNPLRPRLRATRSPRTRTTAENTTLEPLEELRFAHICWLLVSVPVCKCLH